MDPNLGTLPPTSKGSPFGVPSHDATMILGGNFTSYHHNTTNINNAKPGPGSAYAWKLLNERVSSSAIHTSEAVERQDTCLEGTREMVLEAMGTFLIAPSTDVPSVLWVTGPAGAGKSAIMRTVARNPKPHIVVLASFFFFRADSTRNSHTPLIPTLTLQMIDNLRDSIPDLRNRIEVVIDNNPTTLFHSSKRQGEVLIANILLAAIKAHPTSIPSNTSFAILVDGLDECSGEDHQVEVIEALVNIVAQLNRQTRLQVRLIIASRPEPHINSVFNEMEDNGTVRILKLDESLNPDADIKLFYDVHFARIRRAHPLSRALRLGPDWPSAEVKRTLTRKASGQFAFPDTIIKFTKDPRGHPVDRLQMVLDNTSPDEATQPFAALDHLYNTIFSAIPAHLLPSTLQAIGALLAPEPIDAVQNNARILTAFLHIPLDRLKHIFLFLTSLFEWEISPVIALPDAHYISVYHASLADFLFTRNRSERFGLFTDHSTFAQAALFHIFSPFNSSDPDIWKDGHLPLGWCNFARRIAAFQAHANTTPEGLIESLISVNPADTTPVSLAYLAMLNFHIRQTSGFSDSPLRQSLYPAFEAELSAQLCRRRSVYLDSDAGRLLMALLFHTPRIFLSPHFSNDRAKRRRLGISYLELCCSGDDVARGICASLQNEVLKSLDESGWNMLDPDCSIYKWTAYRMLVRAAETPSNEEVSYLEALSGLRSNDFIDMCRYLLHADTRAIIATNPLLQELASSSSPWRPTIRKAPLNTGDAAYLCLTLVKSWFIHKHIPKTREAFLVIWHSVREVLNAHPDDVRHVVFLDLLLEFAKGTLSIEGDQAVLNELRERRSRLQIFVDLDSSSEEGLDPQDKEKRGAEVEGNEEGETEDGDDIWEDAEEGNSEEWC